MVDGGEADDKIIAVLENDSMWKTARNLGDVPPVPVERLQHYFLAYKLVPGEPVHATIGKVCPGAFRALNQLATRMSVMQVQGTTLVAFRRSGPGGSPAAS